MNKIGSSRVIEINNTGKAKSGLPFIKDDYIGTASKLKLVLTDEELSKSISEWDKSLLEDKKDKRYYLVKSNPPFYDQMFVKLKMKYCSESKRNIDVLKTALVINKKTVDEEVSLAKLNEYLSKYSKWRVTIKACLLFVWKNKKGIKYMVEKIELS